ncbi:hypothetical protein ACJMK2_006042, partial [Sinanodonta woodiana]
MKALRLIALCGFLLVTEFVGLSLSRNITDPNGPSPTTAPPTPTTTESPIRRIGTFLPILFILFLLPVIFQGI